MAIDFAGLNDAFLEAFGSPAVHAPQDGSPQEITVIRLDPAVLGDAAPGVLLVLDAPSDSFGTEPRKNDVIEIGETEYRIFRVEVDDGGMTHLSLTQ